jgi:CcmD family protein
MNPTPAIPETVNYLFWAYAAGFLLVAVWVGRLAVRLASLEKRLSRLDGSPKA